MEKIKPYIIFWCDGCHALTKHMRCENHYECLEHDDEDTWLMQERYRRGYDSTDN